MEMLRETCEHGHIFLGETKERDNLKLMLGVCPLLIYEDYRLY